MSIVTQTESRVIRKNTLITDGQLSVSALLLILWKSKIIMAIIVLLFGVVSVVYAFSLPNVYKADALLAPTSAENNSLSGLSSKLGGLASLAGVSLPSGALDKTTIGIEVLKSRQFLRQFIDKYNYKVPLMAIAKWEPSSNEFIIDPKIYDESAQQWLKGKGEGENKEPSEQEFYKAFRDSINIAQDGDTGLVLISFEHYSPYFAKQVLSELVEELNETIRVRDIKQAEDSIAYLKEQLKSNNISELQIGLYELIQSQTETIMLAKASPEYLFRVLDPPVLADKKAKPKRGLIVVIGLMLGFILAFFVVVIRQLISEISLE